uniref:Ribosomal protein L36 n=1 Tax=Exacum affine TaxID=13525 RepID=A0A7T7JMP1_EXAAF|nr:ribosomal protein L36 [Exacum affine]QQL92367.1 ribosomal protein L36 [Exacum affine]
MISSFSESDYPCLCLCLGLEQIAIIRPLLRISRHFSQILRTEALIFIFVIPYLKIKSISESTFWKTISFLRILHLDSHSHERSVQTT